LHRYKKELETNKELFEKGKDSIAVSKNQPQIAGSISWARGIYHRIKRPIMKFITKEDTLDKEQFKNIKQEYKDLSKLIDEY